MCMISYVQPQPSFFESSILFLPPPSPKADHTADKPTPSLSLHIIGMIAKGREEKEAFVDDQRERTPVTSVDLEAHTHTLTHTHTPECR